MLTALICFCLIFSASVIWDSAHSCVLCLAVDTCSNGQLDSGETDIDCGGPTCTKCVNGKVCVCGLTSWVLALLIIASIHIVLRLYNAASCAAYSYSHSRWSSRCWCSFNMSLVRSNAAKPVPFLCGIMRPPFLLAFFRILLFVPHTILFYAGKISRYSDSPLPA